MATKLSHPDGVVEVTETEDGRRRILVTLLNRGLHMPYRTWETTYPMAMIEEILHIRGPAYLCDEIMREEDPLYVQRSIRYEVMGYVGDDELNGRRVLDFGCGGGHPLCRLPASCRTLKSSASSLMLRFCG